MSIYKTLFEKPENKLKTGLIGMIIITSILAGVFKYEADAIEVTDLAELQDIILRGGTGNHELVGMEFMDSVSDYTAENSVTSFSFTVDVEMLVGVACDLDWEDEASQYFQGTNEPDTFSITLNKITTSN